MKQVLVIGAGGTIAMEGAHPWDWVDYGDTGIIHATEGVVAGMEFGLADIQVTPIAFRALPSTGITPREWLELRRHIMQLFAAEPAGIVVTHGTATLEETAFFLHATLAADCPVVVVGAQRPPNTMGSDAQPCLRAAIAAAAALPAGVYVSMNGQIFDPVQVTKTSNHALNAFEAPESGPLADVTVEGHVIRNRALIPAACVFTPAGDNLPRVDIAFSYAGADGAAINGLLAAGAQGIVSAGLPPGRATPGERQAMAEGAAAGCLVVQASRAQRGRVPAQAWNRSAGILSGGGLTPGKIRIVLMLALAEQMESERIQQLLLDWDNLTTI